MYISGKYLSFITVLTLTVSQAAAQQPSSPPPIEADVFVTNDGNNPVPVVVKEEATVLYRATDSVAGTVPSSGIAGHDCYFDVPDGKRLIIDVLTAQVTGTNLRTSRLRTKLIGEANEHLQAGVVEGIAADGTGETLNITAHGPFYADNTNAFADGFGDRDIVWSISTLGADTILSWCSITGRLVQAPLP